MAVFPVFAQIHRVAGPPQGQWTYADWEALPDDGNDYEVIDGILYMSTAPSLFHNWIIQQLYMLIGMPVRQRKLAYPFFDGVGVLMPGCDPVRPDFVIVLMKNAGILHDRRIRGVPDLIAEVLSPGSIDFDEDVKLQAYARAGLPEYAVIAPAERQLRLYRLEHPGQYAPPLVFNEADTVTFDCLPNLPLQVGKLFEGAPDTTL
jgi:Uma2 family endonuclease